VSSRMESGRESSRDSLVQNRSKRSAKKSSVRRGETRSVLFPQATEVKTRERTSLAHPDAKLSVREEIRALAGIDMKVLAALESKRRRVFDEAMDATMIERVTYAGDVTETFEDIDHTTRLVAASAAGRMTGTDQSKSAIDKGPTGPVQILVQILPSSEMRAHVAEVVDVAPASAP